VPDYRSRATFYAQKYGLDPRIFSRQIQQESGFNPKARSPAGALGIAQIVPKWHPGVDPMDPEAALDYAAKHMSELVHKYGNYRDALSVYNSGKPWKIGQTYGETSSYVAKIMGGGKGGAAKTASAPTLPLPPADMQPTPDLKAQSTMQGLQDLAVGDYNPNRALQGLIAMDGQALAKQSTPAKLASSPTGDWQAWVGDIVQRSGPSPAHTTPILRFVGQVGKAANTILTPWGNQSHSIRTTTGNRSAHADGNAADIPAVGAELIRLGQTALITAGMPPAEALKQTGGLFNVGGYQIIFNTQTGGNHTDHLHLGLRGK